MVLLKYFLLEDPIPLKVLNFEFIIFCVVLVNNIFWVSKGRKGKARGILVTYFIVFIFFFDVEKEEIWDNFIILIGTLIGGVVSLFPWLGVAFTMSECCHGCALNQRRNE